MIERDKKLLMIQPGAFGDLFLCAPIAKWYFDRGYEVHWPVSKKFYDALEPFYYVTRHLLPDTTLDSDWLKSDTMLALENASEYDKVINLADRGPHPTAQRFGEKFDECKYRIAGVPISQKRTLTWIRSLSREIDVFNKFINDEEPFVLASLESSRGDHAAMPKEETRKVVHVAEYGQYNIVDWYLIVMRAEAIYAVESAVQCFVEGLGDRVQVPKYLLKRSTITDGIPYTHSPSWDMRYFK